MSMNAGTEALEPGSLARSISDELDSAFGAPPADQALNRARFCAALARAVITHIDDEADVTISGTVYPGAIS
ncbi:MAG: hypothetical protein AAF411_22755 [Myxococcota bacterium]